MKTVTDDELKRFAEAKYPYNYNMQKFIYEQQRDARKVMQLSN